MIIAVDLDPIPGEMHTAESARQVVQSILDRSIKHYNPKVHAIPTD